MVKVKKSSIESKRMKRDIHSHATSIVVNKIRGLRNRIVIENNAPHKHIKATKWHARELIPSSTAVYHPSGTIKTPKVAMITRMATYGTSWGYISPLLNS